MLGNSGSPSLITLQSGHFPCPGCASTYVLLKAPYVPGLAVACKDALAQQTMEDLAHNGTLGFGVGVTVGIRLGHGAGRHALLKDMDMDKSGLPLGNCRNWWIGSVAWEVRAREKNGREGWRERKEGRVRKRLPDLHGHKFV